MESLAKLKAPFREGGSVTAGNASGVNDGACALLIASEEAAAARAAAANAKMDAVVERQAKMAAIQKANEEAALRQQAEVEIQRLKALLQQRGLATD